MLWRFCTQEFFKKGYTIREKVGIESARVIVCAAARDAEKKIEPFLKTFRKSFRNFSKVQFAICESFSSDATRRVLEDLEKISSDLTVLEDTRIDREETKRTVRIASARNTLAAFVRERANDFDFVVVADIDGVNRDLTCFSVETCWDYSMWDMVSANQPLKYYDIWALRARGWSENDCWVEYRNLKGELGEKLALKLAVTSRMRSIPTATGLIPVESAFGGLAIYKIDAYLSGRYEGLSDQGDETCEHVFFHDRLRENGYSLYINSKLVNLRASTQRLTMAKEVFLNASKRIRHTR